MIHWTMPEGTADPGSVPWLCAALIVGCAFLWLIGRGKR